MHALSFHEAPMHMQSASVTSIYFCLPDENTKEATKPARPRTRGMLTMKPQQNKRLHTFDQIANANTVSMDAGLSQFAFAKASSTLFKKAFSK